MARGASLPTLAEVLGSGKAPKLPTLSSAHLSTGTLPTLAEVLGGKTSTPKGPASGGPKHGGGGILGAIEGAGHWVGQKSELGARTVEAIPGGLYQIGKAVVAPKPDPNSGKEWSALLHGHPVRAWQLANETPGGRQQTEAIKGLVDVAPVVEHPLRNPLATAMVALPLAHGLGKVGEAAGLVDTTEPRLLHAGDKQTGVPLPSSHSPAVRGVQKLADKAMQHALDTNPEGKLASHAAGRIGGSISETGRYQARMRAVPADLLDSAARRLARGTSRGTRRVQQAALELTSANTTPEAAESYHLQQAAKGIEPERNRLVAKLYAKVSHEGYLTTNENGDVVVSPAHPKLAAADKALANVQRLGDETLVWKGVRSAQALETRRNAPAQIRAGGRFENPTPGKLGVPSQALLRQRAQVERLQTLHDRALAQSLVSAEKTAAKLEPAPSAQELAGARARLTRLEAQHNAALDQMAKGMFGSIDRGEVARRNVENARALRQQSGKTRNGNAAGYSGRKSIVRSTVTEERRAAAEQAAQEAIARNPNHPASVAWQKRLGEIEQLRSAVNPGLFEKATRAELGKEPVAAAVGTKVVSPKGVTGGSPRLERLGGALSVAKDRLEQMESAAAKRVKPTGIVGGESARPGRGFVSYQVAEPKAGRGAVSRSAGPVIPEAKSPVTSQVFTGESIKKGFVPANVARKGSDHFRQVMRYANTDALRRDLAKVGTSERRSSRDVLLRLPDEKASQLQAEMEALLGKKRMTVDDERSLAATFQDYKTHLIPGFEDGFAADKTTGIGTPAPKGFTWFDSKMLGDLGEHAVPRGKPAKIADWLNSAVTTATVYLKPGHVGTRLLTNLATNVIQGSWKDAIRNKKLWDTLTPEERGKALAASGQHGFAAMPHEGTGNVAKLARAGSAWWARNADQAFRFNSFAYEARRAGFDTPAKFRFLLQKLEDRGEGLTDEQWAHIDGVAKRSNRAAIAYDRLSPAERRYLARFIWFYPFVKGSAMFAGHVASEHPFKAAALTQAGVTGRKTQANVLGATPSYEAGLIPLDKSANPLTTDLTTFSPVAGAADLFNAAARPGTIAGNLNPTYQSVIQLVEGLGPYGNKSKSPVKDALSTLVSPVPEAQILEAALHPRNGLFNTTAESALLRALLGAATPRRVNVSKLNRDAYAEQHPR